MRPRIIKSAIPAHSQLHSFLPKIDFADAYAFSTSGKRESMEDLYIKVFSTAPKWVEYALRFRNVLVAPLGLKTGMDKDRPQTIREGEKAGIFKIYRIFENEVIAGENDRHLNFRVSIFREAAEEGHDLITVSTIVQYHNLFGRMYMSLIAPFHKMVVKSLLHGAVQRLNKEAAPAPGNPVPLNP